MSIGHWDRRRGFEWRIGDKRECGGIGKSLGGELKRPEVGGVCTSSSFQGDESVPFIDLD